MDTQHVAISRRDGGLSIMQIVVRAPVSAFSPDVALSRGFILSEDGQFWDGGITDEGVEMEIARAQIDCSSWRRIEADEIPQDRAFRNAWADAGKIDIDMAKARDIHRQRLRDLRAPQLAALDIEYQRADETGDVKLKAEVAAKKQALRDITADPSIEAATNPAELSIAAMTQFTTEIKATMRNGA